MKFLAYWRRISQLPQDPVQHNWKNPDRISKGSKGLPTGGNTRTIGVKMNNEMEWIRTIERSSLALEDV